MRTIGIMMGLLLATMGAEADNWPDGSRMDDWFLQSGKVDVAQLGRQYVITDYGVSTDSTLVQTTLIQHVIDLCADKGGGVVVIPEGTFLSGALFFPQGTHLHVLGRLKGSDRIADFPVMLTRIEGETCKYFPALVNAYEVDGFTITGHGTIDGNGLRYWQDFWLRRQWNPACTNKDSQRPRLTYIANSKHVTIQDVHLVNSPFWTNHVYKSHHIRYIDCYIYAPTEGVWEQDAAKGAPSSDAIDIDACTDVVVRGCYMHVNDDAVVLKGGKGTWADMDATNGDNQRILIEECTYGRVHGCLTLGSESLHNRNIILRRCKTTNADRVLWLKMRPDTPQHYEYITVEDITGHCGRFLFVHPWTQFYKPEKRDDMPLSQCNHIVMRNIQVETPVMLDVEPSDKYKLTDFWLEGQQVY
jgi:polygalacturonase